MIHINKVGELTGVTVRTLRYYDQIGLLKPASKTEGGHRLYTNEEIKKLQQVQFLKKVGFPLHEIKNMLASSAWDWSDSLKSQLSFVIKEQENLKKIELSLREMIHGIAIEGEENWIAIQKIMQLSSKDKEIQQYYRESVFKDREIKLWEKVPNMTSDSCDSLEWIALIGQLKRYMEDSPKAPKVQNIIRRMDEKRLEEFEGEDEFLDKLWEIRMSPKQSEKLRLYPIDQDVLEFMDQAYAIFMAEKNNPQPE
ncbi:MULTISPECIES: MerR family transcriptional regulator [Bacillus]|uniref:MerR family transcriptional regulator n=1 Tax=Bacillus TaxID=1386 RepID=UPI0001A19712|nr:MerR family transcriptional regulator [Bacillus pseudomycoides]EEM13736.1 Transcriptional regulator, merR [Bacillus pseudomycoides DSM 12442]MED1594205.1 MerR family transcriptional regulator [Bacillus pseudomycoides]MED4714683.1 MerR family transcriptional regulator [Bacillus pseudomycoides]OOR49485.1 MerR family transcriptional regulator [Bacillus pseudomycoides]PDY14094.1 MerR family transcriptional regulator [Bacillus pseudomycoides]